MGIMPSLPSWLSLSDFVRLQLPHHPSAYTTILKPNSYCYKGPIPGTSNGPYSHSLNKLRKHSGCAPRPKGSSSRFTGEARSEIKDFGTEGRLRPPKPDLKNQRKILCENEDAMEEVDLWDMAEEIMFKNRADLV